MRHTYSQFEVHIIKRIMSAFAIIGSERIILIDSFEIDISSATFGKTKELRMPLFCFKKEHKITPSLIGSKILATKYFDIFFLVFFSYTSMS